MHIKDTFPELYKIRRAAKPLGIEDARQRLDGKQGKEYWRSLEELAETEGFEEMLHREFPQHASEWDDSTDRRTFIKLMGASLALAGLSGCSYQPPETIVPYVRQPEELVPGKPLFFATAMPLGGAATGLLVRSNAGRPTKVEGNPDHPASGTPERPVEQRVAATDIYAQAAILGLYDPDRSQTLNYRGEIRSYTAFLSEIARSLEEQGAKQGAGLRFLTETVTSPTMAAQLQEIGRRFPAARWHQFEPAGRNNAALGAQLAFGDFANTVYRFDQADRVLSLDSDFLSCGPASLRHSRDFVARRRLAEGAQDMSRLYAVETTPTNTGMVADHRLAVRPSEVEAVARAIAAGLGAAGGAPANTSAEHARWSQAVARDLQSAPGRSIVIAGDEAAPAVHALAHAMNQSLQNVGKTVFYTDPVEFNPVNHLDSLRELVAAIDAGQVDMLVIVGGNPVYTTPADLKLDANRLSKVKLRVHLSPYRDETSLVCHWHVPEAHFLESWGDTRAFDGTVTIMQPLIAPLYNGKSVHEFLAAFTDRPERTGYEILREFWAAQPQMAGDFDRAWRYAVHDGVVPDTQAKPKNVSAGGASASQAAPAAAAGQPAGTQTPAPSPAPTATPAPAPPNTGLELVIRPDPTIYDGRFANNPWLQELPKPLTKLTWDNAAIVSPATAARFELGRPGKGTDVEDLNNAGSRGTEFINDLVELRFKGRTVRAPVFIMPGQPDNVVTVHLGYGRERAGRVGTGTADSPVGFNAYTLRTSDAFWGGAGLELTKTGETYPLASTQTHFNMEGREIVRAGTLDEYRQDQTLRPHRDEAKQPPKPAGENREPLHEESLYPQYPYEENEAEGLRGYKWAMAIDLSTCVGCSSCVVACQAENNIPVVGKDQVRRGREMHWLRVDAYFKGAAENPSGMYFMPVPCMHCEQAPCEPVCPVHATVHSAEGLNDMVYNRCVGTRYCSNNCPYKVRRFNFLLYQDWDTPSFKLARNPEVTVRSRGVMEKCTYCVQRISVARIEAEKENRKVRDGEIVTACQAACPTEAIIFGDANDPNSKVARLKREPRDYALLADLNTRPRTTYLGAVRNPNPEI
ncbi:MAG TPA: TAT-variant-translocated molybdopterin oxidoreductase [Pyrinomonadaceae bacterium]|nr:TAT-variant-translocated molybdopterin oxidoreductase [Pyrinomonadaceae bacterium]